MKPEIATIWTEALRSGKYKQGKNVLRNADDNFCCLGVLCDLAVDAGVIPEPKDNGEIYIYQDTEQEDNCNGSLLPAEVREWAGVKTKAGQYNYCGMTLTYMNDNGKTFTEIADIIDTNVNEL